MCLLNPLRRTAVRVGRHPGARVCNQPTQGRPAAERLRQHHQPPRIRPSERRSGNKRQTQFLGFNVCADDACHRAVVG